MFNWVHFAIFCLSKCKSHIFGDTPTWNWNISIQYSLNTDLFTLICIEEIFFSSKTECVFTLYKSKQKQGCENDNQVLIYYEWTVSITMNSNIKLSALKSWYQSIYQQVWLDHWFEVKYMQVILVQVTVLQGSKTWKHDCSRCKLRVIPPPPPPPPRPPTLDNSTLPVILNCFWIPL